jgi:uncharacterized RDD family membrane protein YckC
LTQAPDPRPDYDPYAPPGYAAIRPVTRTVDPFLAGRGARLAARVVDTALFALALVPVVAAYFALHRSAVCLVAGVFPLLFTAYQSYLVTFTGQSVAKKWLGLRVVRQDGSPVGFVSGVLVREWIVGGVELVPFVGMLCRLIDYAMILGEDRRCLHDVLSGTKVVLATAAPGRSPHSPPRFY